jgi:hypothetical protein
MFREQTHEPSSDTTAWQQYVMPAPTATVPDIAFAFTDRTGELSPVYREIARRIARDAYTCHASTLGDALR